MIIRKITLHKISLKLKDPFETSFGRFATRETVIVKAETKNGLVGYGEAPTLSLPFYNEEYTDGAFELLKHVIAPNVVKKNLQSIDDLYKTYSWIKLHQIAKTGVESAYWHLKGLESKKPLWKLWGGTRTEIPVGISLGLESTVAKIMANVTRWVEVEKIMRVKIKIKPGMDYQIAKAVRKKYPHIMLMLDANSAYTLKDLPLFKKLDQFNLLMIEQPLGHDDIIDHSALQKHLKTPVCLDESITSLEKARQAIQIKAGKIINIKPPRVGGYWQAKLIAEYCQKHHIPVWCGGMMDSGWGRTLQLHISSLKNFSLPNDNAGTKRYFVDDIVTKPLVVKTNSHIDVPNSPGTGFAIDERSLGQHTLKKAVIE
ncbi:MAG: o-succinylbenzoate synthase [Candidatus Chisholmbacteria bacterium]|nr:o-succinylbenzoate synthase [Candidatus Chisholmbacteria bacterium]